MAEDERARGPARYGLLLITLIAAYLVSAVVYTRWGGAVHVAFVAAIALLAVRHTRPWPRGADLAAAAVLATAVAAGFGAASGNKSAEGAADIWNGLMLLATVVIIIGRVLRLEQVTVQSIYGALSAYLLIGLMFASWFAAIGSFVSGPFFAAGGVANAETLQYFSFTTLTTLGYGDFTAAGSLGRAVAVLEAIAGQVFLATLVARLVSAYGTTRRPRPPEE
jgi:Ion channel